VTSSAFSRPRRARRAPQTTPSALRLRLAPRSLCPHCERVSATVQGVCADCWGSKGGRQFWVRRSQGSDSLLEEFLGLSTIWVVAATALVASIPATVIVISWIWA
jgi:hypothetical protein